MSEALDGTYHDIPGVGTGSKSPVSQSICGYRPDYRSPIHTKFKCKFVVVHPALSDLARPFSTARKTRPFMLQCSDRAVAGGIAKGLINIYLQGRSALCRD